MKPARPGPPPALPSEEARAGGLAGGFRLGTSPAPLLLALFLAAFVANNAAWNAASEFRSTFDIPVHAQAAWKAWHGLLAGDLRALLGASKHGPVGHLPAVALFTVFGPGFQWLYLSTSFWLLVLAGALYDLGRRLYNPGTGVLACLYLFTIPLVAHMGKEYPLEVACHALSVLAAAQLVASDFLRRRLPSLGFGLVLGLGTLTRPEFLAIWALPLALLAVRVLRSSGEDRPRKDRALLGATLLGALLVAAWPLLGRELLGLGTRPEQLALVVLASALALARLGVRAWRDPDGGSPGSNLGLAGTALVLVLLPSLCVRDVGAVIQDRLYALHAGAGVGSVQGAAWLDPTPYLVMASGRALDLLHLGLLGLGLGTLARNRDRGGLLLLGMLAWVFLLVNLASEKTEEHLVHLLGFAALLAAGQASRSPWRLGLAGFLLSLWGGVTVFGWLLPQDGPASWLVHRFGTAQPFYGHVPASLLPLRPNPPEEVPPVYDRVLEDLHGHAQGDFVLVLPAREHEVVHQDWFRMFARYQGIPALVPENAQVLRERLARRPEVELFRTLPVFLAADPEPGRAAEFYRAAFDPGASVVAEEVGVYAFPPGGHPVGFYRLRPARVTARSAE